MKINFSVWGAILVFLFTGCDNKTVLDKSYKMIEAQNLETLYGCTNTTFGLDIEIENSYLVITSQSDYNRLVKSTTCNPLIDFNSYNLLIGKKGLSTGNSSIEYELKENSLGELDVKVKFNQNMAQNAPIVVYNVLIPKKFNSSNVKVEYQIKNLF